MPTLTAHDSPPHPARSWLAWLLAAWLCASGCGGCGDDGSGAGANGQNGAEGEQDEDQDKEKEEKKEPDYQVSRLMPLLSAGIIDADGGQALALVKPGHWTATSQYIKANKDDLEARTVLEVLDSKGNPEPLPHTPYQLVASRPAVVAKDQEKRIEAELFVPEQLGTFQVGSRLERAVSGYAIDDVPPPGPWRAMPSYQYFMLVLAEDPAQYAYLKVTDAVRAPWESSAGRYALHYRVVLVDGDVPPPLPTNPLQWTSIAHLWWDNPNLARINPEQQQALVDWLHWGGRLVINGPDSLDALRGSFLDPYLPADPGKAREITADDLAELNEAWTHRDRGRALDPLKPTKPWSGIELTPREGARDVPGSSGLLVERRVGLGSVVASSMQLAQRDLLNWPGYDSFLNGALLARPPRVFRVEKDEFFTGLEVDWFDVADRRLDAYFTTPLRWFARDAATKANMREEEVVATAPQQPWMMQGDMTESTTVVDRPGGLGAWTEFGAAAGAARSALREAAGVRVPGVGFVVSSLAMYLVVLVPLNWAVFHALRRIEWAWIAAPVIALLGAAAVVHQAQLDIGFVSSQTEIGLLELQGDHPRGHLSRFAGLYTSLSSTFDLQYDHPTAVATPFPPDEQYELGFGDSYTTVEFEKYAETRLRGVAVSSASTQLVHSEEICPLVGPINLSTSRTGMQQVENHSGSHLAEVAVVHRDADGKLSGCWIGDLRDGQSTVVSHRPLAYDRNNPPFAQERQAAADKARQTGRTWLDVDELLKLAYQFPAKDDPLYGRQEETRLVARIDGALPGATATPAVSQAAGATLVVAHLQYGPLPTPAPDANSPADVLGGKPRNAFDEELPEYEEPPEGGDYIN
ncbi:MAG: hypothetical protein CMJ58_28290 [Planctomycetaceae bacterium]|nr:hypothetical protein [Planctomycetaceae bacterium]